MQFDECFSFVSAQATDVGCRREINEDSYLSRPDCGLWVVADGMGGHAAGDFASQSIVQELNSVGMAGSAEDLEARFQERLLRANSQILDHAQSLGRGTIGATLVALLTHGDQYTCIWSGDSRIYLLREGRLIRCTHDHTELQALLDAGSITPEDAKNWPRRNVITRAIGVAPVPQTERVEGTLMLNDRFLLCSDGLTEHLDDLEIAQIVSMGSPRDACQELIGETLARGARDNVTVLTVDVEPAPPLEDPEFPVRTDSDVAQKDQDRKASVGAGTQGTDSTHGAPNQDGTLR
ncbi:MAG: PP2C family protein-serine/threonine phosphatase [Paracoccaceae bacterium]